MTQEERKKATAARQKRWKMKAKTEAASKAATRSMEVAAYLQKADKKASKPNRIEHVQRARLFNGMYYWIKTMAKSLPALAHWRDANHDKNKKDDWRWARRWLRENLD